MLKINKYGFLSYSTDSEEGPKNETLAEHREHCRAQPGNCPFEKAAARSAENEDTVQKEAAATASLPPKPPVDKKMELVKTAKLLCAALVSAAKSIGEKFVDPEAFSVKPSMEWDAVNETEKPTGGFQVVASVHGGQKECDKFLDKLSEKLGISRKPHDCYAGENESRINTHITEDESKGALEKLEEMKQQAEAKKLADAEKAKKAAAKDKIDKAIGMATYAITAAAKTVNFHVEQGDFAPDKTKIDGAFAAKKDMDALLADESAELDEKQKAQIDALQKAVGEIGESYYKAKHTPVGKVPQYEVAKPKPAQKPAEGGGQAAGSGEGQVKGEGKPSAPANELKSIHKALLAAAKTINFHIEQGDCEPNKAKIAEMTKAAKLLHDLNPDGKSDNPDVKALCGTMAEIAQSAKNGWKKKIGMVKPLSGDASGGGFISPLDKILKGHLSGKGTPPPAAGEADDAYEYDADRRAHMQAPDTPASALKDAADEMTFEDAKDYLEGLGFHATDGEEDLVKHGFPANLAHKVLHKHAPLKSIKMFEDTVKCAAAQLKDLNARFPNMAKCHLDCIYPSKAKSANTSAEWVKGDESNAKFSSICFHADYDNVGYGGEYSYGHPDSRLPFDIFRHEYMHGIATGKVAKEWKTLISETYGKPCTGFFKLMKQKVSSYASDPKDIYESLAETFAKITSHDYVPGTLPRKIEDFFYGNVLGCEPAHKHLMHDPNKHQTDKPNEGGKETQASDVSMEDVIGWFAPQEAQAQAAKTKELAFA